MRFHTHSRAAPAVSARQKRQVHEFWTSEACGERYGEAGDRIRYDIEPEIISFADFPSSRDKRLLEIGVGMGSDFLRWLRAGADATGVDLTDRAVGLTRQRMQEEGLVGDVRVADAEALPFEDDEFDIVYSWGVLHHTPNTRRAVDEARRVLRPGGQLKLMIYHRRSWVGLAAWARFGLLRGRPLTTLAAAVSHIESPGTQAFTISEGRAFLTGMDEVDVRPCLTHWDRLWSAGLAGLFGHRFGWFLLMEARKPRP